MSRDKRQYHSMRFQNLARNEYFEGWYFKQVSADENTVICFIPGASVLKGAASPFIQIILAQRVDGTWKQTTDWLNVPKLESQDEPFSLRLGQAAFSRDSISIALLGERVRAVGELRFHNLTALPVSRFSPTIMGPFSYLPSMECIHNVISLTHTLTGSLRINGESVDFNGGKGYIEKDWGSSFPKRYIWLQSNHFSREGSLFFSWADIPMLGTMFHGYIAHLYYAGEHHRFATYTRGRCSLRSKGAQCGDTPDKGEQQAFYLRVAVWGFRAFCSVSRADDSRHQGRDCLARCHFILSRGKNAGR